jgi:cyanate lyase
MTTREEVTEAVVMARLARGISWEALAKLVGRPVVWSTAALLGQHPLPIESARAVVDELGLDPAFVPVLAAVPMRGGSGEVPSDPTIYRMHEALKVYGPTIKELIHEQFGDGIMSAINFSLDIQRKELDGVARVVITFDGKFLPYEWVSSD